MYWLFGIHLNAMTSVFLCKHLMQHSFIPHTNKSILNLHYILWLWNVKCNDAFWLEDLQTILNIIAYHALFNRIYLRSKDSGTSKYYSWRIWGRFLDQKYHCHSLCSLTSFSICKCYVRMYYCALPLFFKSSVESM